jgi:hypothetical protein
MIIAVTNPSNPHPPHPLHRHRLLRPLTDACQGFMKCYLPCKMTEVAILTTIIGLVVVISVMAVTPQNANGWREMVRLS